MEIEGSVRKHAPGGILHALKQYRLTRKIGSFGKGIAIEENVKFQRYPENIALGNYLLIKEGARICPTNPSAKISIGDWTTVGQHTFIFASDRISIGANCLIAPFCYLVDGNHGTQKDRLIREQKLMCSPIVIEDDVWLGTGTKILPGVTVGKGCVVGAGSVVTQDLPSYSLCAGAPAKVIGQRS